MDLTELTDEPELTVTIAGKTLHFSELRIGSLAKLQAWIKANIPDPLVSLRERLKGYPESAIAQVTAEARRETPNWPPVIGTNQAAIVLMGSLEGQVQALWVGLQFHQPGTTFEDAERVYWAMKRSRDEKLVKRIYGTLFGTANPERDEEDETPGPKGESTATAAASNGNSTSARQNSGSR